MSYKDPTIQFFGKLKIADAKAGKVPRYCDNEKTKPSKISDQKRTHMKVLLQKENEREKRERIVSVLMNKLVAKFGVKYTQLINFFVEEFLNSHAEITPPELNKLEKEINNAILTEVKTKREEDQAAKEAKRNGNNGSATVPRKNSNGGILEPPPGSEWQVIQTYQAIKAEEAERKKAALQKEKRDAIKRDLDKQASEVKNRSSRLKQQDMEYAAKVYADVDKYHAEEEEKKKIEHEKGERITRLREQQMRDMERRHQEERDELERMEALNVRLAKESLQRENEKAAEMRRKSQEMQKRILLDNERKLKEDEARKIREAQEEKERQRQYNLKLENEQRAKDAALESKMKKAAAFGAKYESEGAGKAEREQRLKEEQFLLNEQRKKAESDAARERKKIEDRRLAGQQALAENNRQCEEKRRKAEALKQAEREISAQYKEAAAAQQAADAENARKRKEKQEGYRQALNAQMTERAGCDTNLTGLSETERKLNLSMVKEALSNPEVASKFANKGASAPSGAARKH